MLNHFGPLLRFGFLMFVMAGEKSSELRLKHKDDDDEALGQPISLLNLAFQVPLASSLMFLVANRT